MTTKETIIYNYIADKGGYRSIRQIIDYYATLKICEGTLAENSAPVIYSSMVKKGILHRENDMIFIKTKKLF